MRALLAVLLLLGGGAAAAEAEYVGRPLLALVGHPDVPSLLRQVSGGQQGALARAVRLDGPGLVLTGERYLHGHACAPEGCGTDGVFIAYDTLASRLYLLLVRDGDLVLQVPPRRAPWPDVLEPGVLAFGAAPSHLAFAPAP